MKNSHQNVNVQIFPRSVNKTNSFEKKRCSVLLKSKEGLNFTAVIVVDPQGRCSLKPIVEDERMEKISYSYYGVGIDPTAPKMPRH